MTTEWIVQVSGQAKRSDKNLSKETAISFVALLKELKSEGPYRATWPNYTKMLFDNYHCHINAMCNFF